MTRRRSRPVRPLLLLAVVGLLVGTTGAVAAGRNASGTPAPDAHPVLLAAGDIATCDGNGDEATAQLLDRLAGTVAVLGDGAYPNGTATDYAACYDPTWGRHKARTRPTPGNHDYDTAGAAGYFGYFGAAAGDPAAGYYAYDLGAWHVVVLNSNCAAVAGCGIGSPQERWLRTDLADHPAMCTLAYWHHPRFGSGEHGDTEAMAPLWQALYEADADVVLAGHDHDYERFAPQDPAGRTDPARGIVQFVVGTGGKDLRGFDAPRPASVARNHETFGVLALTLGPAGYDWAFVPVAGQTFGDAGSRSCH